METKLNKNNRLMSLDALRGADMFLIMGLTPLIISIAKLFPESTITTWIIGQMYHVEWHGWTLHDTIFPLFLFIAGISFPFSLAKQQKDGKSSKDIYLKIFKRGIILIILGVVYNGFFQLDFENIRYASVLGRIGLGWMFAALLYVRFSTKTNVIISIVILVGYWLLLWLVPNSSDPFSFENNLVGVIDRILLPGTMAYGSFDPEGILSTMPSIVTALLGMFTGKLLLQPDDQLSIKKKITYMLLGAILLIIIGWLWSFVFPINKKLWTSTFVLVVGGYSLLLFTLFYYIIDVKGYSRYSFIFRVVGLNSITIYLAQRIIDFRHITAFFLGGVSNLSGERIGAVIIDLGYFVVCWLFLYFLYKKKIFLKI